jgi:hypothetical protein
MKRKGRKVQLVRPGERRQYAPGQLIQHLNPEVRNTIERLARLGYEQHGRGLLMVEISDEAQYGIVSADYVGIARLTEMHRRIPFAEAQPGAEAVKHYDPEREFVALVVDITPSLPGPQLWVDVFPRMGVVTPRKPAQTPTKPHRGRRVPPPTPKQEAAMVTAYARIEDMARAGYAEKGRGFMFNAIYPDGTKPYLDYLTLDSDLGQGFVESTPDLVEMVRTYDPQTSFIMFDGKIDMKNQVLTEVEIDVVDFLMGKTTSSA